MGRDSLEETLRWGYTWIDVRRMATFATSQSRVRVLDRRQRYESATDGITMLLATAITPPSCRDLENAAFAEINTRAADEAGQHGLGDYRSAQPGKRFEIYWTSSDRITRDPMESVDDKIALVQVWERMRERDRETIAVLAAYLDHAQAARSLGVNYSTWISRVWLARQRIRLLWFTPEQAPGHYMRDHNGLAGSAATYRARVSERHRDRRRKATA